LFSEARERVQKSLSIFENQHSSESGICVFV
jgi:hypothetical protein